MKLRNGVLILGILLILSSQFVMKDAVHLAGILAIMAYILLLRRADGKTALMVVFWVLLLYLGLYFIAFSSGYRLFN